MLCKPHFKAEFPGEKPNNGSELQKAAVFEPDNDLNEFTTVRIANERRLAGAWMGALLRQIGHRDESERPKEGKI